MNGLGIYICVAVVTAATAGRANGPEWYITTVDDEGSVGKMCSLALDREDNPHIVYWDAINHGPRYAYFDGSSWQIQVVDRMDRGGYSSFALDLSERPHIAYDHATGWPFGHELKYAYYDGSSWRISVVDDSGYAGPHTSIALDSQDRPHISYGEFPARLKSNLKYAHFDGTYWHTTYVDYGNVGYCTSIALDSHDNPHISYRDDSPLCCLKYSYKHGSSWHVETVDKSKDATGAGTSIAVDSRDRPHISYQEDLTEAVKYAYYDGSRWYIKIVDDDYVNQDTSIALDERDRPHISYCAQWGTGGPHWTGEVRYAYYDGKDWHREVIETGGLDSGYGDWNSLALDSDYSPHVAYEADYENSTYESLKYACLLGSYLNYFNATPKGYDALALKWSVKPPMGERFTRYNLYRREKGARDWRKVNEATLPGGGSGSYDGGLACLRCYEYLLEGIVEGRPRQLGITEGTTTAPQAFVLHNARPNPWSSKAVIAFELMDRADVELAVYDLSGRKVATLAAGWLPPGAHEREVSALAPGVYVYRLSAGDWGAAKKMVVVR